MTLAKRTAITVTILLMWKIFRTDWVVAAPDCYNDTDPPASFVYGTATYYPPTSPLWDPPTIAGLNPTATVWDDFFQGSGTYWLTGPARLSLHGTLIGIKLLGGAVILMSLLSLLFPGPKTGPYSPKIKARSKQ